MDRPRLANTQEGLAAAAPVHLRSAFLKKGCSIFTSALPPVRSPAPEGTGNRRASRYDPRAQPHLKTSREDKTDRLRDPERLETWVRYSAGLCRDCHATCCTLPVEVRIDDLIRLELVDAFERDEPAKNIAAPEQGRHRRALQPQARDLHADAPDQWRLPLPDRKARLCTVMPSVRIPAATTRASDRAPVTAPIAARPTASGAPANVTANRHGTGPGHAGPGAQRIWRPRPDA